MAASVSKLKLRHGPHSFTAGYIATVARNHTTAYQGLLSGDYFNLMARNPQNVLVHGEFVLLDQVVHVLTAPLGQFYGLPVAYAEHVLKDAIDSFAAMRQREPDRVDMEQDHVFLQSLYGDASALSAYVNAQLPSHTLLPHFSMGQALTEDNTDCKTSEAYNAVAPLRFIGWGDSLVPTTGHFLIVLEDTDGGANGKWVPWVAKKDA